MSASLTTLGRVLENVESFPWEHALYLPQGEAWSLGTRAMVLNPDDSDADEGAPSEAQASGLVYALDLQSVRGVVDNARQQRPKATHEELLRAFLYYYDHDAFVLFQR